MDDLTGLTRLMVGGADRGLDTPAARARGAGRETIGLLEQVPLFASLSRRHLAKIASVAATKRYAAGSPVVRGGSRPRPST